MKKIIDWFRTTEEGKFFQWLVCYSFTIGGIMTLVHIEPIFCFITIAAYIGSMFTLLNWMKK